MTAFNDDGRPTRRDFLRASAAVGLLTGLRGFLPAQAATAETRPTELRVGGDRITDLVIARTPIDIDGRRGTATTINGMLPGPLLRFREGETVTLRVTNQLDEHTAIHWHGILVPQDMDGVPGVSFPGIEPGETFTYRYQVRQNGTYWYHSHAHHQEQEGVYGPLIIEPAKPDPVKYEREYAIVLSDWSFESALDIQNKLKKQSDYYNFQQRTVADFMRDVEKNGVGATLGERMAWGRMRMSPTDIADVSAYTYTYLVNGHSAHANWTALFRPGERVRLRFVNASAQTFFNVRIPGLDLTVVQADGQNVRPVTVDEFQIAVAETFDVIVHPKEDEAYTIFTESMDRSGYGRATLAPRPGMNAPVPALRERPARTMIDMGMDMNDMNMSGMKHGSGAQTMRAAGGANAGDMPGMDMNAPAPARSGHAGHAAGTAAGNTGHDAMPGMMHDIKDAGAAIARHGPDTHGPGNSSVAWVQRNRLGERGTGLADAPHRVLVYSDLRSLEPNTDTRSPEREIEMHLTGNMETFMWGFDGKKFSEAPAPVQLKYGERVRITFVNDTMMEHPMHLHGMFKEIDVGAGRHNPRKHTISVKPAERLSFDLTADEPGNWAFHCHLQFHQALGMFRIVNVPLPPKGKRS